LRVNANWFMLGEKAVAPRFSLRSIGQGSIRVRVAKGGFSFPYVDLVFTHDDAGAPRLAVLAAYFSDDGGRSWPVQIARGAVRVRQLDGAEGRPLEAEFDIERVHWGVVHRRFRGGFRSPDPFADARVGSPTRGGRR